MSVKPSEDDIDVTLVRTSGLLPVVPLVSCSIGSPVTELDGSPVPQFKADTAIWSSLVVSSPSTPLSLALIINSGNQVQHSSESISNHKADHHGVLGCQEPRPQAQEVPGKMDLPTAPHRTPQVRERPEAPSPAGTKRKRSAADDSEVAPVSDPLQRITAFFI